MNKIISKLGISGLLILMMSGMAHAVEEPYWGLGVSSFTLETDSSNLEFDMEGVRFTLGSKLTDYFGIETRFIIPTKGSNDGGVHLNTEQIVSLLTNYNFPLGPLDVYLNLGYSNSEYEVEYAGGIKFDEEGWSYGGGASFRINRYLAVYGDVTSYLATNEDFSLNSVSAGIRLLIQ